MPISSETAGADANREILPELWRQIVKPDYVFISGVSRTGSTLLLKILNRNPDIAICRENYFLGHQVRKDGIRYAIRRNVGDLTDDANVRKLVDFLYDGKFKRCTQTYWRWLRTKTDRKVFLQKILAAPERNDRTIFVTMLEMHGDWLQQRKGIAHSHPILGEKTPSHIYHVPTLLRWFPNSRVIHTFRDPRGIFASELRVRSKYPLSFPYKQLYRTGAIFTCVVLLQVTLAWLRAARLHYKYERLFPDRYFLSRFEDLVTAPRKSIKHPCDLLDVDLHNEMLEQKVVSRGYNQGQPGFDQSAAHRWQEVNPPWVNQWFLLWGRKTLADLNYEKYAVDKSKIR
jgi:hypothetical protein